MNTTWFVIVKVPLNLQWDGCQIPLCLFIFLLILCSTIAINPPHPLYSSHRLDRPLSLFLPKSNLFWKISLPLTGLRTFSSNSPSSIHSPYRQVRLPSLSDFNTTTLSSVVYTVTDTSFTPIFLYNSSITGQYYLVHTVRSLKRRKPVS